MDFTALQGAMTSLIIAKELGKAALGVRDFNEMAPIIAKLNDQLLNAQERLFELQSRLFTLQQEHFETAKQLTKITESINERSRYSLFELSEGNLAYRVNLPPMNTHMSNPIAAEPLHYLCQRCFDKGIKVVLIQNEVFGTFVHRCPECETELNGARVK